MGSIYEYTRERSKGQAWAPNRQRDHCLIVNAATDVAGPASYREKRPVVVPE